MNDSKLIPLHLEISASKANAEEIDRMTRQLQSEFKEHGVESAEIVQSDKEMGLIGSLALSVLPAVLPSIISIVQAWASRESGRIVKFKGQGGDMLGFGSGQRVEFQGSPAELQKLLDRLAGDSSTDAPPPKKKK
jgi:hypothetical protein